MKSNACLVALLGLAACNGPLEKVLGSETDSQTLADAAACQRGDPFACTNVADALTTRAAAGDQEVARQLFEEACRAGAALACIRHAEFLSPDEAAELLDETCTAGEALACERLGSLLRDSDPLRAYGLFGLACEDRLFRACYYQGTMLKNGEGVSADPAGAFSLFRDLCANGGAEGCRENAKEMLDPQSPHADPHVAEILAHRACAGGDGEGCWVAAEIAGENDGHETNDADVFRRRACEFGYPENCEL